MAFGTNSFWGVVLPVAKTNLMTNPSFERGTTGWSSIQSAVVGSTADFQRFGAWAGSIAPTSNGTSGCLSPTFTFGNGTEYRVSFYAYTNAGLNYRAFVSDTSGAFTPDAALGGSVTWTGGGSWHQYSFNYGASSAAAHKLAIKKDGGGNTGAIYLDGVQVEVGSLTTYIDGDQEGCVWNGAPHNSTSARSGQSRAGGSIVALSDLGFRVSESIGLGMPPLENTSQSYALLPGAEFQRQRAGARPFVLTSRVDGTTWPDFHNTRRAVINALKIDAVSEQQPTRFFYVGGIGTVQIDAVIDSGMEGGNRGGDGFGEDYGVRFVAFNPYFSAPVDQGTSLVPRVNIGSANFIVQRSPLGVWGTMGIAGTTFTGVSGGAFGGVRTILVNNGTIFAGGSWGSVGGTAGLNIAQYFTDTGAWGTLPGGAVGLTVRDMVMAPSGSLFVGGEFLTAGGTRAVGIAQWNGAYGTLGPGTLDNNVWALALSNTNVLYVGGQFLSAAGTQAPLVARWTSAGWGTLVGGTVNSSVVRELAFGADGKLYAGGNFTQAGGTTANRIASWNNAWGTLSYGADADVYQLAKQPDGRLVAAGLFGSIGSVGAPALGVWNGQIWQSLGSGLQNTTASGSQARALLVDPNTGDVYAGGVFNRAGGRVVPDSVAHWNGYTWLPLDIDLGQQGTIHALAMAPDKTLFMGGTFAGTALAASVTTIVNVGAAQAYPIFKATNTGSGTARLYQLLNTLIGAGLYFDYTLIPGEEVVLNTTPGTKTFTSSFFGNIFGKILGGSNLSTFRLLPGTNYISFFADSDNVIASFYWRPRNWSADGTAM